ncbi:hypothetical protein SteCoe_34500 [Stentor coeruleus]|uniref:Uncharacterized protein n=1 Tax=Stentor coeruleus TaxID=5963 RepID=A0A1R2AUK1_9CILI|nr:hypothetical protein SteCoe_34500 [Stentor coeruleus]
MDLSSRRRDPILQVNIQSVQQKVYKTPVPSYMKVTSWLENKPKGIGRGQFHAQSDGSFRVGREEICDYKPTKKVYAIQPPYSIEKPEGTKKLISQTMKNPILEPEFKGDIYGKKVMNFAFCTSKEEDMRFVSSNCNKQNSYSKRNSSSVFNPQARTPDLISQKKRGEEKPSMAKDILRYEYALPYRDEKITSKIY